MADFDLPPDPYLRDVFAEIDRRLSSLERASAANLAKGAAWVDLSPVNGFANANTGYAPIGVYADPLGRVNFRGLLTCPAFNGAVKIADIPDEFLPAYSVMRAAGSSKTIFAQPATGGDPTFDGQPGLYFLGVAASSDYLSLEGFSYRTK